MKNYVLSIRWTRGIINRQNINNYKRFLKKFNKILEKIKENMENENG